MIDAWSRADAQAESGNRGPLAGVRVLELATVLMGPFASQILADMGADVIKVESSALDGSRSMGGGKHAEFAGVSLNVHRNKRSIQLELRQDAGLAVLNELLDGADVFITNSRPGALRRRKLDYETLSRTRPRLIYCEAHGFRSESSESERPAYDGIIQAETGLPRLAELFGGPARFLPTLLADKTSALYVAMAVLGALVSQRVTGMGQRVEVAMFDALLSFNLTEHLAAATFPDGKTGYSRILTKHCGPYRALDGYVAVIPYSDEQYKALYTAVGREEELDAPEFQDHRARLENADHVYGSLARLLSERTTAECIELCTSLGVAAAPVPTLDEIVNDAQLHRGIVQESVHPEVGTYRQIRPAFQYSKTSLSIRRHAPRVGQHTVEILAGLGHTKQDIDAALKAGWATQAIPSKVAPDVPQDGPDEG